jgi:hypothetical protein
MSVARGDGEVSTRCGFYIATQEISFAWSVCGLCVVSICSRIMAMENGSLRWDGG